MSFALILQNHFHDLWAKGNCVSTVSPAHQVLEVVNVLQALVSEVDPVKVGPGDFCQSRFQTRPHAIDVGCEKPLQVRNDRAHGLQSSSSS